MHEDSVIRKRYLDGQYQATNSDWAVVADGGCPVCGANNWQPWFHKQGYDFIECRGCTLMHLDQSLRAYPKQVGKRIRVFP